MEPAAVQRRTLRLLFATQIVSGTGVTIGSSVGALLAADIAGVGVSGLAQSAIVIGAALFALPATAIVYRHGRRPSLALAYFVAGVGAFVVVSAAMRGSIPLLFTGFFLFGGASAAGLQARYAAVDLAPAALRGRHLSLIVWATTLGAVVGPSLAPLAGVTMGRYGVPALAGPFVFSALLFLLATLLLLLLLRPDPAVVARETLKDPNATAAQARRVGVRAALGVIGANPPARLGVTAVAVGNLVMVGVMAMTPVHIRGAGHEPAHTLRIVGLVLSSHIAGMFAFAPVVGWLTDRLGRRQVIFGGIALLLLACAVAGTAGHDPMRLALGGAPGLRSGALGSADGTGGCLSGRGVRCGGERVGLSPADTPGCAGDGSAAPSDIDQPEAERSRGRWEAGFPGTGIVVITTTLTSTHIVPSTVLWSSASPAAKYPSSTATTGFTYA
jgi:MFS family permease